MLQSIKTKVQYEEALERAYELMQRDLVPGTADYNELDVLGTKIESYENEYHPVPPPIIIVE